MANPGRRFWRPDEEGETGPPPTRGAADLHPGSAPTPPAQPLRAMRGLAPGTVIAGRYEILEWIGEGAHAVTYRARDQRLGRLVAVKILRPDLAANRELVQRFVREAQFAARVSHPNVVDVYDVGTDHDASYIVLRYIDGTNLKQRLLAEGRLPVNEALNLTIQVLRGLSAIHAAGIVHRDIKPQNILIGPGGDAQVTDFGVAYAALAEGLTTHGMTVGTASYMAPEQARGDAVTPQSDVYAVGVVLFEMLTGQLPFQGPNPVAVMLAHIEQPVPMPSRVAPDAGIPTTLDHVVARALAKPLDRRFLTAAAMADELVRSQWSQRAASATLADEPTVSVPVAPDGIAGSGAASAVPSPAVRSAVPDSGSRGRPPAPLRPPVSGKVGPSSAPQASSASKKWLTVGTLALLLVAAVAGAFALTGGFDGDNDGSNRGTSSTATARSLTVLRDDTPTATATSAPLAAIEPTATVTLEPTATPSAPPTSTPLPPSATTEPTVTPTTVPPTPTPTELPPTATVPPEPTSTPVLVIEDSPPIVPITSDPPIASTNGNGNGTGATGNSGNGNSNGRRRRDSSAGENIATTDGGAVGTASGSTLTFTATQWAGAYTDLQSDVYGRDVAALYGEGSGYSVAALTFTLESRPAQSLVVALTGLDDELPASNELQVVVNGTVVSETPSPFGTWDPGVPTAGWGTWQISVAPEVLKGGQNVLEVRNLTPGGTIGRPPYVLLGDLEMRTDGA